MGDSRETFAPRAFVTGWPIKHSRSPIIHTHWLKTLGVDGSYEAIAVQPADFRSFLSDLKDGTNAFVGGNVTLPHKEAAYMLADKPDALAEELGAANTLWVEDGRVRATNTDGFGFVSNLDALAPGWDQTSHAVVLGAGGASRAIIKAIRDRGIGEIHVVNRTVERARELADRFGPRIHAHPENALKDVMHGAGLFINTTSLGMDGTAVPHIDFREMQSGALVTDIVYVPLRTPILDQADQQGVKIVDGLGMLLHQAAPGFERWFRKRPVVDAALRDLIIADMGAHK